MGMILNFGMAIPLALLLSTPSILAQQQENTVDGCASAQPFDLVLQYLKRRVYIRD